MVRRGVVVTLAGVALALAFVTWATRPGTIYTVAQVLSVRRAVPAVLLLLLAGALALAVERSSLPTQAAISGSLGPLVQVAIGGAWSRRSYRRPSAVDVATIENEPRGVMRLLPSRC